MNVVLKLINILRRLTKVITKLCLSLHIDVAWKNNDTHWLVILVFSVCIRCLYYLVLNTVRVNRFVFCFNVINQGILRIVVLHVPVIFSISNVDLSRKNPPFPSIPNETHWYGPLSFFGFTTELLILILRYDKPTSLIKDLTATPDRLDNSVFSHTPPRPTNTNSSSCFVRENLIISATRSPLKTQRITMYPLSQSLSVLVISNEIDVDVIAEIEFFYTILWKSSTYFNSKKMTGSSIWIHLWW